MLRTIQAATVIRTAAIVMIVSTFGGCSGGRVAQSQSDANVISGTVRLGTKIVNYGSVTFYDLTGKATKTIIMSNGTYTINNPPLGEVRVVIRTGSPPMAMAAPDGGGGEPMKFERLDIPAQYSDPDKTDLRFTVTPGKHQFDIDLKPDNRSKKS